MFKFTVSAEEEGLSEVEVEAFDHEGAASEAMEAWEARGAFAGDPFPERLVVNAVDADGKTKKVKVVVDWSPSYLCSEVE